MSNCTQYNPTSNPMPDAVAQQIVQGMGNIITDPSGNKQVCFSNLENYWVGCLDYNATIVDLKASPISCANIPGRGTLGTKGSQPPSYVCKLGNPGDAQPSCPIKFG